MVVVLKGSAAQVARKELALVEAARPRSTVESIAGVVGVTVMTISNWRRSDGVFRARWVEARDRAGARTPRSVKVRRRSGSKVGFEEFRLRYMGFETFVHQATLVDALQGVRPREVILVLMWPEAGKSTTLVDWICEKLGEEPNERITVVSESASLTRKMVGRVKNRMTDQRQFGEYINDYGPFYVDGQERNGKPWAADYIRVFKAQHDEQDFSLEARAWKSKVYGTRIDTLIIDDVQSRASLSQTEEIFTTLRQTFFTRGRMMRTVIIGTRLAPNDVYARFMEEGLVDKVIIIPAAQPDGSPTEPRMWEEGAAALDMTPREFMESKFRDFLGAEIWAASYQQNPVDDSVATFTEEMLERSHDIDRKIVKVSERNTVGSLDPALGGGNALIACEHRANELSVLDVQYDRRLARVEDILIRVERFADQYRINKLIVEVNAFQKALANDHRLREMGMRYGFRVIPHSTGLNKTDGVMGVGAMAGSFIRGEVRIPWGDEVTRSRMRPLHDQLHNWNPNLPPKVLVQDCVMGLWFNWRHWMDARTALSRPSKWDRAGLPWTPQPVTLSGRN